MNRVIKVGGRVQASPALIAAIHTSWSAAGAPCIVHGGGDEITSLQRRLGMEPVFVGGRRVTSAAELEVVRMALGAANKRLVSTLITAGVPAVGLSGEDGGLIRARPLENGALGCVGMPSAVDAGPLLALIEAGYVPVVSPVARMEGSDFGAGCTALNVNGDDAASAIAAALGAGELLLIADVDGVRLDGEWATQLDADQAERLIAAGAATGGMEPKLRAAVAALDAGVSRVRIGGFDMITRVTAGTTIEPARSLA